MPIPDPVERDIDAQIADLEDLFGLTGPDVCQPARQILIVNDVVCHAAGFVRASGGLPEAQAYLVLTGGPSPSSEVTRGFLRFVPRADLRAPSYSAATKTITLWLPVDTLVQVLAQVRHGRRYLWIGWFGAGQVYGDLHTAE